MNEPTQNRVGDNSPQANASAHVGVGMFLAIAAFGIACVALGFSLQVSDIRNELLQVMQMTENRIIADNREKATAYTLLDSHVKELENRLKVEEKVNERRR